MISTLRGVYTVVAYRKQLMKFTDENEKVTVDIHEMAIEKMVKYLQADSLSSESGGVLLGYMDATTSTINIIDVTEPSKDDVKSRAYFLRKSISHVRRIQLAIKNKDYYVGNWHTHPQNAPFPSSLDVKTWSKGLKYDKVPFGFQIYIVCGIEKMRVWIGEEKTKKIHELNEVEMVNGLYK